MQKQDHSTNKFAEDLGMRRDNTGFTNSTSELGGDMGPGRGGEVGSPLDIHKAYHNQEDKDLNK
jgi:hypothetical protein